jgi:hypothetical protein
VEIHPSPSIVWATTKDDVRALDTEKKSMAGALPISFWPGSVRVVGDQLIGLDRQLDLVAIGIDSAKTPKENWRTPLPSLPITRWVVDESQLHLATAQGILLTLNLTDGKVVSESKLARSMRDGPIRLGSQWFGLATDGSLVAWPK